MTFFAAFDILCFEFFNTKEFKALSAKMRRKKEGDNNSKKQNKQTVSRSKNRSNWLRATHNQSES